MEYHEHNVDHLAIEVVGQNWSSEVTTFFREDWEVGVALSCHLSMDLLCQEIRDACGARSESLVSPRSLCSECQRSGGTVTAVNPLLPWTGCDRKARNAVREMNGEGMGATGRKKI